MNCDLGASAHNYNMLAAHKTNLGVETVDKVFASVTVNGKFNTKSEACSMVAV